MTDPTQLPNVVAANEHLHRQLTAKDARIRELEEHVRQWQLLYRDAAERRDDLEAEVLGLRTEAGDSEDMAKYWHRKFQELNAQLNGEAA
jgi:predicted  nucleic acid-binding Zn-ribbon protein